MCGILYAGYGMRHECIPSDDMGTIRSFEPIDLSADAFNSSLVVA